MNAPVTLTSILEAADSYALVDLETVKDDLGITTTTDDAYLQRRIDELSRAARQYMNRTLQMETVRDSFWAQRDPYPWQLPGGYMPLQLSRWPIVGAIARSALAPPLAPTLSQATGSGSEPAATFYVVVTYDTIEGETLPSAEASLSVDAGALLTVAAPLPAADSAQRPAIGWNVYVGTAPGAEMLQNGQAPLPMGASFTMGAVPPDIVIAPPPATIVNENGIVLLEGVDYLVDNVHGHLTRLFAIDLYPTRWATLPITVEYRAGYPVIPADVSGALSRAVKSQYMARSRDPAIKSQSASGIYAASYATAGSAAGGVLTPDVYGALDGYRVPVIA
jgi:hypothetical protein